MRTLVVSFLLSAVVISAQAQKFVPGYMVGKAGDTTLCEVDFRRWDYNPLTIRIRKDGTEQTLSPNDISAFFAEGETYVSAAVEVELSPAKLEYVDYNQGFTYRSDVVFLHQLVRGEKSLYFLKDQDGKRHLYIFDGKYVHLDYKKYRRDDYSRGATRTNLAENKRYVGQLTNYLKCDGMVDKINKTPYEESAIIKLFMAYNKCASVTTDEVKPRQNAFVEWGPVAGVAMASVKFSGHDNFDYLVKSEFEKSLGPSFGLFVDVKLMRGKGSRVTNDFMYTSFDITGVGHGGGNGFVTYETNSHFNFHYIKTHHAFQWALLDQGRFYLSGGFSFGVAVKHEASVKVKYETGITDDRDFDVANAEMGVVVGAGSNFERFGVDVRYEWSNGISEYRGLNGPVQRGYVLLKYRLRYKTGS